ncbi:MAG: phosphate permease [Verrucomicrobiia bacterium Tous-C3TDCM]|nr:MAG: phosphate permease [Verrucomicrobiae bacterium Tous-C3TDCM]PAZ04652.1 MAG: phosphate permease [Verrucomicrobiae bacterium AMD-G2]
MSYLLLIGILFLAYSNGSNDNFKGVASLYGSGAASYRTALIWATAATLCGSLCSIFLAQELLKTFSGKGLVPDHLVASQPFLLAVAMGAGTTVILATKIGFPISTTHGLTGALVGAGMVANHGQVAFAVLGKQFVFPLLLSPLLAVVLGGFFYLIFRFARLKFAIGKETCICIGGEKTVHAMAQPQSVFAAECANWSIAMDSEAHCTQRYTGTMFGINCQRLMDVAHFLSAGVVSFARGLNDTPKIAALLLVIQALEMHWGMSLIGVAMALGGIVNSRKIAETMGRKITDMNHGQGFSANFATGLLVIFASKFGLPVSTTHVSCGALYGMGLTTRKADSKTMRSIVLSWVLTLPIAAVISAVFMCVYV